MSIREKIKDILSLSGCSQLFLLKHREIDDAIKDRDDVTSRIVSAIKDELMRVIPKEKFYEERNAITLNSPRGAGKVTAKLENAKVFGFNAARSQMISAVTKLCEEEKCTN